MEYSNPKLPEGINTSQEHPLKELFWLMAGIAATALLLLLLTTFLADRLVSYIPFSVERQMSTKYSHAAPVPGEMELYLNALAERIAAAERLPEGMKVDIHYLEADTVNAFATLGGHIYIFRGLLKRVHNENTLAMVLAHEIAHIKQRDPIHGASRAVVIGLALSSISSSVGDSLLNNLLSQEATLTLMKYSREQERRADDEALAALHHLYGHSNGAAALFEALQQEHDAPLAIEFFSSHPLTQERLAKSRASATDNPQEMILTPLPQQYASWLKPISN